MSFFVFGIEKDKERDDKLRFCFLGGDFDYLFCNLNYCFGGILCLQQKYVAGAFLLEGWFFANFSLTEKL